MNIFVAVSMLTGQIASAEKDTIQQSSAGVPISPLPKSKGGYESLHHAINSMPHSTLKNSMLQALKPSRSHIPSPTPKDVATEEPQTEP